MAIIGDDRSQPQESVGPTALNMGLRFTLVTLTLVAGTAAQAGVPPNALAFVSRTAPGGVLGELSAAVAAGTLTVNSSNAGDTSAVVVLLLSG